MPEQSEALDQGDQGAARVRNDVSYVRVSGDGARVEEVDDGPGGVEEKFEDRSGECGERDCWSWCVLDGGARTLRRVGDVCVLGDPGAGRVDEYDGLTAVEFGPDWLKTLVAEVPAVVVGFDRDAVGVQGVEGVGDFRDTAFDVREGKGGPEAKMGWIAGFQVGCVGIAVAAELAGRFVVAWGEEDAW